LKLDDIFISLTAAAALQEMPGWKRLKAIICLSLVPMIY
jgi:hypothetical protein